MELYERVAEAISAAKKRGVSVTKIADECGISRQAVYQWMEVGASSIDGANLVELAELSGYNAMWIIKGKGRKTGARSDDERLILDALQFLDPSVMSIWLSSAKEAIAKNKPELLPRTGTGKK